VEKGETLDDRIRERDQHQRGPGYPEHRPNPATGKARRAMNEEAEPGKQQHGEDPGDDEAFTLLHGYASTTTSL
jgi:hypothetical protein